MPLKRKNVKEAVKQEIQQVTTNTAHLSHVPSSSCSLSLIKPSSKIETLENNAKETAADIQVREECDAARYSIALWCASCFHPSKLRVYAEECLLRDSMRERFVSAIENSILTMEKNSEFALDVKLHATIMERVLFWRWYYLQPAMYRQRCRQIEFNLQKNGWYMLTHFGPLTICAFPTRKLAENTTIEEWRTEHRRRLLHDLKPPTPKKDEKGLFQCGKCKSWRTTYYPFQTRGGDESTTNFVTCHDCNNHFRKS